MADMTLPASKIVSAVTVRLRVTGIRRAQLRFHIAAWLMVLAARIGGFNVAVVASDDSTADA